MVGVDLESGRERLVKTAGQHDSGWRRLGRGASSMIVRLGLDFAGFRYRRRDDEFRTFTPHRIPKNCLANTTAVTATNSPMS
jgi:hypothetical protein